MVLARAIVLMGSPAASLGIGTKKGPFHFARTMVLLMAVILGRPSISVLRWRCRTVVSGPSRFGFRGNKRPSNRRGCLVALVNAVLSEAFEPTLSFVSLPRTNASFNLAQPFEPSTVMAAAAYGQSKLFIILSFA